MCGNYGVPNGFFHGPAIAADGSGRYTLRMPVPVRTRFAPSPTGFLHVGGARTALFNWLFARKHGGSFVLRVEDTDQARNTPEARGAIFDGLNWLGLDWDEGPEAGGEFGPYFQSERKGIYDLWFERLQEAGRVYEDDGAWRFRFERRPVTVEDLVCGEVTIDYRDESNTPDMVVRRSDGSYVFHFVNVIDDLVMKISHVIRGEDHLMNTPKHLQIFEALEVPAPRYAHLPLILNADGSKMSKRDKGAAVAEYPRQGFLPEAVVNFMALLGWSPKNVEEVLSMAELRERFSLEGVNRAPARFDWEKCRWLNQQHLMQMPPGDLAAAAGSFMAEASLPTPPNFTAMAASVQDKVQLLSEIPDAVSFYLDEEVAFEDDALHKIRKNAEAPRLLALLAERLRSLEDWDEAKGAVAETAKAAGAKPGQLMFPLRVALTGRSGGPDLAAVLEVLGREESIRRIESATRELQEA